MARQETFETVGEEKAAGANRWLVLALNPECQRVDSRWQ
jgi:hypothetical protein